WPAAPACRPRWRPPSPSRRRRGGNPVSDFLEVLSQYDIAGAYWINLKLTFLLAICSLILATILAMMRISPLPSLQWAGACCMILMVTFVAPICSLILGRILAMMRSSPLPSLQWAGAAYVNLVRNSPLTVVMMFAAFVLWTQLGVQFSDNFTVNNFWLA